MEKVYKFIAITLEFDEPAGEKEIELALQRATVLFKKGFRHILAEGNISEGIITVIESKEK